MKQAIRLFVFEYRRRDTGDVSLDCLQRLLDIADKPDAVWVRGSERIPTREDADCQGQVWVFFDHEVFIDVPKNVEPYDYWMPTGLVRPEPPKGVGT
jgi:hypothetical protein